MFPDNNHIVKNPKFFSLTLTNEKGAHFYMYCLKFSERYHLNEYHWRNVPIVICVQSNKEDYEPFKELLYAIHQIIINELPFKEHSNEILNNYKKVELLNLFVNCLALRRPPPHSLIKFKLNSALYVDATEDMQFYFSSNCEISSNKNDTDIATLFNCLDQTIIIKLIFAILTERQII